GSPRRNRSRRPRPAAPARDAPGSGAAANRRVRVARRGPDRTSSRETTPAGGPAPGGRGATDPESLLVAGHLAHVEHAVVDAAVRIADRLRLLLTLPSTRIAGMVGGVVRAAGRRAQPRCPDLGAAGARRERKRQQGHHGRGQQHFPGTHRYLLLVDGRLAVLVRDPHGPDPCGDPVSSAALGGIPAAYLSASR